MNKYRVSGLCTVICEMDVFANSKEEAIEIANDDNGGCWGCKWLDEVTDECTSPEGRLMCDTKTNDMWEWKGLED